MMERFERLCTWKDKRYAVITKGPTVSVGKAVYAADLEFLKEDWSLFLVYNGVEVGRGYATAEEALADAENVHEHLKKLDKSTMPKQSVLKEATKMSKANYIKMIEEDSDGE